MSSTTKHGPELTLYRGWLEPGRYVWSPFVIKLEARLRFAGVRYDTKAGSAREAPRGKIPYVEIRQRGSDSATSAGTVTTAAVEGDGPSSSTTLADSTLIIKHLVERGILPDINAQASSPTVRAQDLAIRALLEDKLYFYHVRTVLSVLSQYALAVTKWSFSYYLHSLALWTPAMILRQET